MPSEGRGILSPVRRPVPPLQRPSSIPHFQQLPRHYPVAPLSVWPILRPISAARLEIEDFLAAPEAPPLRSPESLPRLSPSFAAVHGAHPPFHVAVIGFDSVIAIAPSSLAAVLRDLSFGLQLPQRGRVTTQAIPGEYVGRPVV